MMSWHLNIWKFKIWEQKKLSVEIKTFFLVSQVISFKHTKQTSKNVADTIIENWKKSSKRKKRKLVIRYLKLEIKTHQDATHP